LRAGSEGERCGAGEQAQSEFGFHGRFSFCGFGCLPFCCGLCFVLPRGAASIHSSSAALSLDALALPREPPELATAELDVPRPGATVIVEPSGIVVVPLKPFGPEVTLLDMAPCAAFGWRSSLRATGAVDERDDALAEAALEDGPLAAAQARLVRRSFDAPCAGNAASAHAMAPSGTSARSRKVFRDMM
jgi:hypothetical protein